MQHMLNSSFVQKNSFSLSRFELITAVLSLGCDAMSVSKQLHDVSEDLAASMFMV